MRYPIITTAFVLLAAPAALAQGAAGTWSGQIRCTGTANLGPLVAPFKVTVSGTQARYERPVFNPQDASRIIGNETGSGTVAPDGSVKLTGDFTAPTGRLSGNYEGKLSRPSAMLTGGVTTYDRQNAAGVERRCRITLTPG
jgi:hypothetical protein